MRTPNTVISADPLMRGREPMLVGGREPMLVGGREPMLIGGRENMLVGGMGSSLDGDMRVYDTSRLTRRSSRHSQDQYSLQRVCNYQY